MRWFKGKKKAVVATAEFSDSSYGGSDAKLRDSRISEYPSLGDFERKDLRYKTRIRFLRFVSRTISLILSAYMIGSMTYTLIMYLRTKARTIEEVSVWGAPKVLWPTYLVLSVSVVTFLMNFVTLSAYLCSINAANKSGNFTMFFGYVMLGVEIVVWAVSSGLYKFADTGSDLWGYTCGKETDKFVGKVESFVNFGKLCQAQNVTWYACLVQTAFHTLTLVTLVLVVRRASGKRQMRRIRESQMLGNVYEVRPQTETAYKPGLGRQYMPVSG